MRNQPDYTPAPAADFVLPFDLPNAGCRGRLVRLDRASARALSAHALPEAAARVAGESVALAAILGTALKLDGRLTLQTKSDGPLDLVTVDYFGAEGADPAGLRGFARLDGARFSALNGTGDFAQLAGRGALAITIEPRLGGQTYQGIVELSAHGIAASGRNLFRAERAIADRDPAGGRAGVHTRNGGAGLARGRHHAAGNPGTRPRR
jgi:molecular chaperone Hsp33